MLRRFVVDVRCIAGRQYASQASALKAIEEAQLESLPNQEHAKEDVKAESTVPLREDMYKKLFNLETPWRVHFNLEGIASELQIVIIESFTSKLKKSTNENELRLISFNQVTEDVFRYCLNMPLRKLGFKSLYTRYNHDTGLATFYRLKDVGCIQPRSTRWDKIILLKH